MQTQVGGTVMQSESYNPRFSSIGYLEAERSGCWVLYAEVAREDNLWLLRQNGHNHMALCSTANIASIIECVVVSPLARRKTNGILSVCLQYSIFYSYHQGFICLK
ncbi:hypothetical protein V8G54_024416 [Vigna mungo]|uniref:Uncharacterized protein n=1 Tax=Vigna mungo TaxID=3915 RepID=A0AAQ3N714_VIGMU